MAADTTNNSNSSNSTPTTAWDRIKAVYRVYDKIADFGASGVPEERRVRPLKTLDEDLEKLKQHFQQGALVDRATAEALDKDGRPANAAYHRKEADIVESLIGKGNPIGPVLPDQEVLKNPSHEVGMRLTQGSYHLAKDAVNYIYNQLAANAPEVRKQIIQDCRSEKLNNLADVLESFNNLPEKIAGKIDTTIKGKENAADKDPRDVYEQQLLEQVTKLQKQVKDLKEHNGSDTVNSNLPNKPAASNERAPH